MKRETAFKILKQHETELRQLGVVKAALVGSLARQESSPVSDIDVVVQLAPEIRGFYAVGALDRVKERLESLLETEVDVIPEPVRGTLAASIESDRYVVF